jgi:CDP-diacylglycerol---glycerol-3-phosphate 3-phosphatidyltransferase
MPSVYDLKPRFQALLRPLIRGLAAAGCTANTVTVAALVGSFGIGTLLLGWRSRWALLAIPVWLFLRMALNAIDGMMARELGMASRLGAVLNELGDVLSDLALYLPLAVIAPPATWPVIAFSVGAVLTELAGVLAQALGDRRRYEGPMGKSDRAFVVGAVALATAIWPEVGRVWPGLFGAAALLTLLTCWNRLHAALAALAPADAAGGPHGS